MSNNPVKIKDQRFARHGAWVFAIEFPDGTIAVCRGGEVKKIAHRAPSPPDNWLQQIASDPQFRRNYR